MARRSGGIHKGVEEKRRSLPIYQHYTLSPGKTKSHHPEAKCNHCLKEFVCGSKQRLIRHLRKCNSISNPDQIIAETLNTLARNSATGQLNHSILEASNLLPSQVSQSQHHHQHHHHQQQQPNQQFLGQQQQLHHNQQQHHNHPHSTTANSNITNDNNNIDHHNTSGLSSSSTTNDGTGAAGSSGVIQIVASSSNGASHHSNSSNAPTPVKRPLRRGRKPANHLANSSPTIHVTTGLDGKTHFTPASQLPSTLTGTVAPPLIGHVHNGRQVGYTYNSGTVNNAAAAGQVPLGPGAPLSANSGHLACSTPNHHPTTATAYKLNSDHIDRAYLKLVLTRNLPLSLCDTREFQFWVKTFANDYKPPSSINLIAQNLKNEAQAAKQRISNILVKAPKKTINLELHSWPDEIRGHLWYTVLANIDQKRFLISIRDINVQQHLRHQQLQDNSTNLQISTETQVSPEKRLAEFIDDCIKRVSSDRINSLVFSDRSVGDELATRARKSLYTTHPSIVTYYCWWHFTNLICSDIIEHISIFQNVMRNSNRLIDFVNKQPRLGFGLEKFSPFVGVANPMCQRKNDRRWYSHLVCYLLEYIKNNNDAIMRVLEACSTSSTSIQSQLPSDNNNNSSSSASNTNNTQSGVLQHNSATSASTQQQTCHQDAHLNEIKSIVMSSDYWTNLNLALVYLKPIHDLVALTTTVSTQNNNASNSTSELLPVQKITPSASTTVANGLLLSDYMGWFLNYGKTLFDSWLQAQDGTKHQLIERYLARFSSSISEFKLLFAAYLLNPKHRCAYMTQNAKNLAIEEILNIASEFMPEESDGHTIFDQWKLYLIREEPYDMVYEENRSTPLEWWMSLPCAESIRRVALRILRLKAFTSNKPETLFSTLYFYEDEMNSNLNDATFEDIGVLRYFYDFEDKIGQTNSHSSLHNNHSLTTNNSSHSLSSNGYPDRTQVGQLHNQLLNHTDYSTKYSPPSDVTETNGQPINEPLTISDGRQSFSDSFSDVVVESYMNHLDAQSNLGVATTNLSIEDLPGYDLFTQYIDYNETGVQIVEEPTEKKKRKWTAQEILSKCQSIHQNNNNNDISSK